MRKNYFRFLSVLIMMCCIILSFSSCSDDNENDDNTTKSIELKVNNRLVDVYTDLSGINYKTPNLTGTKDLNVLIFFEEMNSTHLSLSFIDFDLDKIKVGDDLSNHELFTATLNYKKEIYYLGQYFVSKDKYQQYKGKVIVREYDKSKQLIELEFSGITVPLYRDASPDYNSLVGVDGIIKCTIKTD